MVPLTRILVPVDFSERSPGAAHFARFLADHFSAEIVLLHVINSADYAIGAPELAGALLGDWNDVRKAESQKAMDSFLASEFAQSSVRKLITEGDPAVEIVRFAHDEQVNVIVLPTHGYGPFRRFILGSVTAKVLHDSDCPVLTGIHMEQAPPVDKIQFRNILCAVDLGPQSEKTLGWASCFAQEFGATLHLAHALPMLGGGQAEYFDPDWRLMLTNQAKEQLEELQQKAGTTASITLDNGDVSRVVHQAALATRADLVVIGRSSSAGILGRLRANAYAIIRESPCPVVSI
jgi:nucleotide-binding universal stress UspA family protein